MTFHRRYARATFAAACLAHWEADHEQSLPLFEDYFNQIRIAGDGRSEAEATMWLGVTRRHLGVFDRACSCFDRSVELYDQLGDGRAVALALPNKAMATRFAGNYELAVQLSEKAAERFHALNDPQYEARARTTLAISLLERGAVYGPGARLEQALLLLAQGDVLGASSAIEQMVALAERLDLSEVSLRLKAEQVRLWLTHGQADAAFRWADAPGLRLDGEPTELTQPAFVTLARVHIARARSQAGRTPDDVKEALMLLARFRKKAEAGGHQGQLIEILALEALALAAQGLHAPAVEALARALALAEPEGYVRTLVDEGAPMARVLEELAADQRQSRVAVPIPTPRYVEPWMAACRRFD